MGLKSGWDWTTCGAGRHVAGVKQADYLTGKTLRAALNKLTAYITEREFLENDHRVMEIERKRLTGAVKAVEYGER